MTYERRVLLAASVVALPSVAATLLLLWTGDFGARAFWTVVAIAGTATLLALYSLHEQLVHPLRTLSNMLAALREEDYSLRSRGAGEEDALAEVMTEVNQLSTMLREQRLDALEATALVTRVMTELDTAILVFDGEGRLRLANRAAERLLAQPVERLLGRDAADVGIGPMLSGEPAGTIDHTFPGGTGRFGFRRSQVREKGLPHHLLMITDLSRALREEERQAWQRLVRVLGHEMNNSLAPIKSIAGSLETLLAREPLPEDWKEDVRRGLGVVAARAEALSRFMNAYATLTRLPPPTLAPVEIGALVRRVAALEQRMRIEVAPGPEVTIPADAAQLEQLLINLVRNAVEASLQTGGAVTVAWETRGGELELSILDEGPGISSSTNLFVPFYTTKPGGTGIGLVLSRQIAEAHGGTLSLENRHDGPGCEALLRLPMHQGETMP
ncbi:MAG: sensor histidine kinase [Thermoanaerobaculia bacterium]